MSAAEMAGELPRGPVTVAEQRLGLHDAVAAALTRIVGSMPALYITLVIVGGWMTLATWGPLHRVDPYPFAFLLFLDNVAQLVLCSVILVGQRVLGMAADRRAVQTYENTEAIFAHVADLQVHLDRHDQVLSRGVSLLDSSAHPWIQTHRVQPAPQAIDQVVGVNGRVAAWLTQRLGSMWAFYISAGTQILWIIGAELGLQRFDPYPFAFMTFLSTLAQLIFMLVIMVGQEVLGRAADQRSEQTYLDAEAVLHECRRMKARLTAQDRVLDALADYATAQATEQLAAAIHRDRLQTADEQDQTPDGRTAAGDWDRLPEEVRQVGRHHARQIGERLAAIGCLMVPTSGPARHVELDEAQAQLLARLEYENQAAEHSAHVAEQAPASNPVAWHQLSAEAQEQRVRAARRIPAMLADAGFQILKTGTSTDGPGEADFTPRQWAKLQQIPMTAGVVVALAEGVIDADEIFALIALLRQVGITHPRRLIRELATTCTFDVTVPANTKYADYAGPALTAIRTATALVARTAPGELDAFRAFLTDIATTVADANDEGGFFGLGARPRTPHEAAAIEAIRRATELDHSDEPQPMAIRAHAHLDTPA